MDTQRSLERPSGPAIVLVRPQLGVNIGTTARAMANFGLTDLRLVAPRAGWPLPDEHRKTAEAAAASAMSLLASAQVYRTVPDAIADLQTVYATTARECGQGKPVLLPSEAMPAAAGRVGERCGILFGPERTGLDNDDIVLADAIVTFPVDPAYGSLNLAQAVLLMAYEWLRASQGERRPFDLGERSPPARKVDLLSFFDYLDGELTTAGYFRPEDKAPIMRRNLRNIFQQIALTEQDVRTLRGAVVRLVEGPRLPGRRRDPRGKKAED